MDDFERKLQSHAHKVRRLYAIMAKLYSGGNGIDSLGEAMLDAAESYTEVSEMIEAVRGDGGGNWWKRQVMAREAIEAALSPPDDMQRLENYELAPYDSFAANAATITKLAAKTVAHKMLGHPGNGSRPEADLRETVVRVGIFHGRRK